MAVINDYVHPSNASPVSAAACAHPVGSLFPGGP